MKFFTTLAVALLVSNTEAANLSALRRHHHHHNHELVSTLPDYRTEIPSESDIAAHENARAEAAKTKANPQSNLLASIKEDLDKINTNMSFGVSYSQSARNTEAKNLCAKVATSIKSYANGLIGKIEGSPVSALTEQNAHNMAAIIFYDVLLEDAMKGLGVEEDADLVLATNRLKSLQKLYLFEQKGGENYLS